jgi:hypothetical protein
MRRVIIATSAAAALFSSPAFTQQPTASIPDFSGIWAHPSGPAFEPPASGPGPVVFAIKRGSPFVGDYTNPILKPQAAEVVKKHGEIELSGLAHPLPSTHCWPSGVPYIFFSSWHADLTAARQDSYSSETRSLSFTSGIMNSATCA